MTHDIQDLLNLIKDLEERIINLEVRDREEYLRSRGDDDSWYWDH